MPRRLPLAKRFNATLTAAACARLRARHAKQQLGNGYLLTLLLGRLDDFADPAKLDVAFRGFISEYGAPAAGKMAKGDSE